MQEMWVWSLGWEDLLKKEMATVSSILAWEILWIEKPTGLWSMESQRVRHNWVTERINIKDGKWAVIFLLGREEYSYFVLGTEEREGEVTLPPTGVHLSQTQRGTQP